MPWSVKAAPHGGWNIVRTATGEVVGHSNSKRNAILSVWHRKKAEGMLEKKKAVKK